MTRAFPGTLIVALLLLALSTAAAPGAASQASAAEVNINTYLCPADYDQVSDCEKIGGVTVSVQADGMVVGEVATLAESGVTVDVLAGQSVTVSVVGGQPDGTTLQDGPVTFDAVEGLNAVTLTFVRPSVSQLVDTDDDGVTDGEEAALGSDPNAPDSDGDGIQDGGEHNIGTDPLVADTDGDGFLDGEEFDVQTDPLDPNSFPVDSEPNSIVITAYTCPEGFDGKDPFTNCTTPAAGIDFVVYIPGSEWGETKTTGPGGSIEFTGLGGGTFVIAEDFRTLESPIESYSLLCAGDPVVPDAPEPRQVVLTDLGNGEYSIDLTSGDVISCAWFNTPAVADADPESTPTPKARTVTALPSTGTGAEADTEGQLTMTLFIGAAGLMMLALTAMAHRRTT